MNLGYLNYEVSSVAQVFSSSFSTPTRPATRPRSTMNSLLPVPEL